MTFYTHIKAVGNKILIRERDPETGLSTKRKEEFNPSLFVPEPSGNPTGWKDIKGRPLKRLELKGIAGYWDFKKKVRDGFPAPYGDIAPEIQYISENYQHQLEVNPKDIRIFNFDIEVDHDDTFPDPFIAKMPITAIALYDNLTNTMKVFGLEHENSEGWHPDVRWKGSRYNFDYKGYETETEMLEDFVAYWSANMPDMITGWFTEGFDVPYIINRLDRLMGPDYSKKLSPWGMIKEQTKTYFQKSHTIYEIVGISHLDYMRAYKKYAYTPQESFKLDHIAYSELGDNKLSYDEVKDLPELYRTNYQKFIDYNIKDVDIVQRLEEKRGFLSLIATMAYYAKVNYDDVASPIRIWDSLIYNYLKPMGIQINPNKSFSKSGKYEGAFVKTPIKGRYDWIVSVDLASEYPSLMRGLNISPDTFLPDVSYPTTVNDLLDESIDLSDLKERGISLAANGTGYIKDTPGFFTVLLTELFEGRKKDKARMLECQRQAEVAEPAEAKKLKHKAGLYHVLQYSKKILLNSAYGATGNQHFRWYNLEMAEAVTLSGQLAIRWAEKVCNEYFNEILDTNGIDYVTYIDTDSIYLNVNSVVKKFMPNETDRTKIIDKLDLFFTKKVIPVISDGYKRLYEYMNHREQLMFMDREAIADKAVFCSKKHYFLRVHDSEGIRYAEPKVKIMGMGFIKTSVPEFCRKQCIENMVPIALDGDNAQFSKAIAEFEEEFNKLPVEDIAIPSGVSNITKYITSEGFAKGTPPHSKGAAIYNRLHKEHDLGLNYELIKEEGNMRYVYLKKANPIREEVIGFVDYLPEEFGLHDYVDRSKMFQRSFVSPISEILQALNWDEKPKATIDFLFG